MSPIEPVCATTSRAAEEGLEPVGLVRALGSLVVVGALAGSGYAAYELYDAQQVDRELVELRAEIQQLRDRQSGLRAGSVSNGDLGALTVLVRGLDGDLAGLRRELARLDVDEATLEALASDIDRLATELDRLTSTTDALARCLERGLIIDEETGRARCETA